MRQREPEMVRDRPHGGSCRNPVRRRFEPRRNPSAATVRYLLLPVFRPGGMQSIIFLDRESRDVWRCYSSNIGLPVTIPRTALPYGGRPPVE